MRTLYIIQVIACLLLIGFGLPASAASGKLLLPVGGGFILPAIQAPEVLKQCSRSVPKKIDGYWDPAATDIANFELRLRPFLSSIQDGDVPPPGQYNRQYAGFKQNGIFYIYGNFYPSVSQDKLKKQDTVPVLVCDGGPSFWGVVYRVDTGQFQALTFNPPGNLANPDQ